MPSAQPPKEPPQGVHEPLVAALVRSNNSATIAGIKTVAAASNAATKLAAMEGNAAGQSGLAATLAAINSSALGQSGIAATLAAIERNAAGRIGAAAALAAIPPIASIAPIPSIDAAALRGSMDRAYKLDDTIAQVGRERARREAAVAQATLDLVEVANAQRVAINTLVAEAQNSAKTERKHFRITLSVGVVVMVMAIVAAWPVLMSLVR
jgi:hypothetical protein